MVSLFGDLAQKDGKGIEGPLLSAIMQGLDIKPEATRVALHRLRKDGWLTSEKSGRISHHSLTEEGRKQSALASPRIYADPTQLDSGWQLVIVSGSKSMDGTSGMNGGFTQLSPRVFVGPSNLSAPEEAISLNGESVPAWLILEAQPHALKENYAELLSTLQILQEDLELAPPETPIEIAVLRCLIVHNWRRLVLKHPLLPAPLIDSEWPGHQCHVLVWELLSRFERPLITDLNEQLQG